MHSKNHKCDVLGIAAGLGTVEQRPSNPIKLPQDMCPSGPPLPSWYGLKMGNPHRRHVQLHWHTTSMHMPKAVSASTQRCTLHGQAHPD